MSWKDFLCLQVIELSTRQLVYGTNAKPTSKEKTATTIPLDPATYPPLAPSTLLHALLPLTTRNADSKTDELSLLPLQAIMDTLSFTL